MQNDNNEGVSGKTKKDRKEYNATYYKENRELISEQRRLKREMMSAEEKEIRNARARDRYKNDAVRQKSVKDTAAEYKAKLKANPKLLEEYNAKLREKRANDPVYRARKQENERKRHKERMANDPAYREYRRVKSKETKERRKQRTLMSQTSQNDDL